MIRTIIERLMDPMYMKAYFGFVPFILLLAYGIMLIWKGITGDTSRWVPRWMYFVIGIVCIAALPAYAWFLQRQGLL